MRSTTLPRTRACSTCEGDDDAALGCDTWQREAGRGSCRHASITSCGLEIPTFPDGETYLRFITSPEAASIVSFARSLTPTRRVLPLIFAAATARELGATKVGLVAPYLAYMRQDRRFKPGEAVTSRQVARLLSDAFDWLVTVDPHLHRYSSLADIYNISTYVVHAAPLVSKWIKANVDQSAHHRSGQRKRAVGRSRGKRRTCPLLRLGESAARRSRCRDQAQGPRAVEGTDARSCRRYYLYRADHDRSRQTVDRPRMATADLHCGTRTVCRRLRHSPPTGRRTRCHLQQRTPPRNALDTGDIIATAVRALAESRVLNPHVEAVSYSQRRLFEPQVRAVRTTPCDGAFGDAARSHRRHSWQGPLRSGEQRRQERRL